MLEISNAFGFSILSTVGEPGKSVEGGWTFTNADGSYELTYKADEAGFQPKAEHIPVPVEDTNEVVEARANFYSLFKEHEAKVKEALEAAEAVEADLTGIRVALFMLPLVRLKVENKDTISDFLQLS